MASPIFGANSVYGGKQGSGQAYILPEQSLATQVFLQGLQDQDKKKYLAAQQAYEAQKTFNAGVDANIAKLSPGDYYSKFTPQIQKDYGSLINDAQTLKAAGTDPFTNPEFLAKKEQLLSRAKATNEVKGNYDKLFAEVSKSPDGFKNGTELLQQYQNLNNIDDYISGNFKPGKLEPQYRMSDVFKETNATPETAETSDGYRDITTPNRSAHIGQAITALGSNSGIGVLKDKGAITNPKYINGFPTVSQKKDGSQSRTWSTDEKKIADIALEQLQTDAQFEDDLASFGYDVSTPDKAIDSAIDFVKKQNKAVGSFVNEYASELDNKVSPKNKEIYEARRFDLSQKNFERLSNGSSDGEIYRKDWVDRMIHGGKGSGEELKAIVASQGIYSKPLGIKIEGDNIIFTIPGKQVSSADETGKVKIKTDPGRIVTVNKKNPADKAKLNSLINELTGEKISNSKFQTGNSNGKTNNKPSTIPSTKFKGVPTGGF